MTYKKIMAAFFSALVVTCVVVVLGRVLCVFLPYVQTIIAKDDTSSENIVDPVVILPDVPTSGLWNQRVTELSRANLVTDEEYAKQLSQWQKVNSNVGAIINLTEFGICEPVICNPENNKTWLRTNIYGQEDKHGAIFLDYRCDIETSSIKLIHGHNMADDTMFGRLPELINRKSCSDVGPVELYLAEGKVVYEAYSVISINSKEEALPIDPLADQEDLEALTQSLLERSIVPGGVIHSMDTLILNTCWYGKTGTEHNLHCIVVFSKV